MVSLKYSNVDCNEKISTDFNSLNENVGLFLLTNFLSKSLNYGVFHLSPALIPKIMKKKYETTTNL